jgi:ribonuclease BN (tRNA processing enzyme)
VRDGDTALWMDCGAGTFGHLQRHVDVEELTAVVITHAHPDHCVDLYGLHVLAKWGLQRTDIPVYGPSGLAEFLEPLISNHWGDTFDWHTLDDGARESLGSMELQFSRTDHPLPTYAVDLAAGGKRLVYTADTGPDWSVGAFAPEADLVLSEATYLDASNPARIHLSAKEAGLAAREAKARRLMLTHIWPRVDPAESQREAAEAFGGSVELAEPHLRTVL